MVLKRTLFLMALIILILPLVSSAPPVTTVQQVNEGYTIIDNPQTILKQNNNYQYNFFVSNLSNGALKINDTTSCIFYLANSSGEVIFYSGVLYVPQGYWQIDIAGGNFSNVGFYNYGTRCNSSTLAGATAGIWEVTSTGFEFTTPYSILYIVFIIASFGLLLLCLYFTIKIPFKNQVSDDGSMISINDLKYVKIFLMCIDYLIVLAIVGFMTGIMNQTSNTIGTSILFTWVYWIMLYAIWPIYVCAIIFSLIIFLNDKKLKKALEEGIPSDIE